MHVVGIVAWIVIGLGFIIYKRGAESSGSGIASLIMVGVVVAGFCSAAAAMKITDSAACALAAGVIPLCLFFGWANGSVQKGITIAAIFSVFLCIIAVLEFLRHPTPGGLLGGMAMGIFAYWETEREKAMEAKKARDDSESQEDSSAQKKKDE